MDLSSTGASFQSTMWSLVIGAAGHDRAALESLLRAYWSPVYAFIRKQGYSGHDSSDLTQEFLTQVVLGRDLAARANPERGRFRAFLKQALRNFLIDQHRGGRHHKGRSLRHKGGVPVTVSPPGQSPHEAPFKPAHPAAASSIDNPDSSHQMPASLDDPSAAMLHFDRSWAAAVIEQTLDRLEAECNDEGLEAHWLAFDLNVLGPALRSTRPLNMTDLARRIGARDAMQASNMVQTIKRRFRRSLREVVAQTVADPAQVEAEIAELRAYFGTSATGST